MAKRKGRSMVPSYPTEADGVKHGLPPVARPDARLLILGSLPGERSLEEARYYAHPQNHFWRLVGEVLGTDLASLPYEARLATMAEHRVALWDVIGSARRQGSLDAELRDVEARDLGRFVAGLSDLRAVAFNGATAAKIGRRMLAGTSLELLDLPSSSPAYTLPFATKAERWAVLVRYLVD